MQDTSIEHQGTQILGGKRRDLSKVHTTEERMVRWRRPGIRWSIRKVLHPLWYVMPVLVPSDTNAPDSRACIKSRSPFGISSKSLPPLIPKNSSPSHCILFAQKSAPQNTESSSGGGVFGNVSGSASPSASSQTHT
ncbi:hypothetical protein M378DRAFT_161807 [Amanita muscaria Koide BX008]|uniref:Uncharacterized protein n=1 Tax=Amanita muscaria (strain Koide BX008) TaxID=946122 RepID=A0A0C2X8Z5_AMAMK|nr:hypothetical protein M378DRAFT_161807 [Amanita muscaria Koide BX008]